MAFLYLFLRPQPRNFILKNTIAIFFIFRGAIEPQKTDERQLFWRWTQDVKIWEQSTYQIVGSHEADVELGKLSVTSPLSRALIGKTVGDSVEVTTPSGSKLYEVIKVQFK